MEQRLHFFKKLLFISLLMIAPLAGAQDVITTVSGEAISCSVEEVDDEYIVYRVKGKAETTTIAVDQITQIQYKDGYVDHYGTAPEVAKPAEIPFDIILMTTGATVKVIVEEVGDDAIVFRRIDTNAMDRLSTKDIAAIRYSNGYEEAYTVPSTEKAIADEIKAGGAGLPLSSRDVVKLRDGTEIKGKVAEMDGVNVIILTRPDDASSRKTIPLSNVLRVKFADGVEDVYPALSEKTQEDVPMLVAAGDEDEKPAAPAKSKSGAEGKASKAKDKKKGAKEGKKEEVASEEKEDETDVAEGKAENESKPASAQLPILTWDEFIKSKRIETLERAMSNAQRTDFVDLSGQPIKKLPEDVATLTGLKGINLSKTKITAIPEPLMGLPKLSSIWLNNTGVQSVKIKSKTGTPFASLTSVSLDGNKMTKLPTSLLELPSVRVLSFNNNRISDLQSSKTFKPEASALTNLFLSQNRLKEIPAPLRQMTKLTHLDLSVNQITSVSGNFKGWKNLKVLKLNHNPIKSIDAGLYSLSSLELLNLNQTSVSMLPDSISRLAKLRVLVLPSTFTDFPSDFGGLKSLSELHINNVSAQGNVLDAFPESVLGCQRLQVLDITGCRIGSVPREISKLKRLESVYLSNNGITDCPVELFTLPNLKVLDLSGNRISKIPAIDKSGWAPLERINLSNSTLVPSTVLMLRKNLPDATIEYFDSDFGMNFTSAPLPQDLQPQFRKLFADCEKGDPGALFVLGNFFRDNKDYGLAVKAYREVAEKPSLKGSGKAMVCLLNIAEIYDDVDNKKPYSSPYKRKRFGTYDEYNNNTSNDKAYQIYEYMSNMTPADESARDSKKKACARAKQITDEKADALVKIYEYNKSEIERLIQGSGNMQQVSAGGQRIMDDASVTGDANMALLGGFGQLFGAISSSVKDDKADRLKRENENVKREIGRLRDYANELLRRGT